MAAAEEAAFTAVDTTAFAVDAAFDAAVAEAAAMAADATAAAEDVAAAVDAAADLIAAAALDAAAMTDSAAAAAEARAEGAGGTACVGAGDAARAVSTSFVEFCEAEVATDPTRQVRVLLSWPARGDGACEDGDAAVDDSGDVAVDGAAGPTCAAAAAAAASAFAHDESGGTVFGVAGLAGAAGVEVPDRDIPAVDPTEEGAAKPLLVFWLSVPVLRAAILATADHNSFDLIGGNGVSVH